MAARKPWWQLTKTVRQGYVGSGLYAIAGLFNLVAGLTVNVWMLVAAVFFLVAAPLSLVSALALRRRERSGSGAGPAAGSQSPRRTPA
jgi:hypothetical protein